MQTTLHMLKEHSIQMMSYIIQTCEGRLIVIDSGNKVDAPHLLEKLVELGGPEPVIDLWLLTHPHNDHVDGLLEIFSGPNPLKVKKIYSRFLSPDYYEAHRYQGDDSADTARRFAQFAASHEDICFTLGLGKQFFIDDVTITTLRVPHEDIPENVCNNSSLVFRVEVGGQRILFVGDLGEEAGDLVLRTVPAEDLKADFIQMAHHGQSGVKKSFYETVAPKACLWNTPDWLWENNAGNGYNTGPWRTFEVRGWMEDLQIRHHFISKDGDRALPLPYALD